MSEAALAIVYSQREWANRVVRHITDHGGGRVRLRVVDGRVALEEEYDVLIAEDITSFLNPRFVQELRRRGRLVLGVFDPEEPTGKERLLELGVDDVIEANAPAETFVRVLGRIMPMQRPSFEHVDAGEVFGSDPAGPPAGTRSRGQIWAVGAPPGGCGASEVAVQLARALRQRGRSCALLDAEEVAPSLAQRLGLPPIPNIRSAIDVLFHGADGSGDLQGALMVVAGGGFELLAGLANPADWAQVRGVEAAEVTSELAFLRSHVVANVGSCLEDLAAAGGPDRYGMSRALVAAADAIVGVCVATPVGVARMVTWLAEVSALAPATPVHVAVNQAPSSGFIRSEVGAELRRSFAPASLHFLPSDDAVVRAAWRGELVVPGPFTKAVDALLGEVAGRAGAGSPVRRHRRFARRGTLAG